MVAKLRLCKRYRIALPVTSFNAAVCSTSNAPPAAKRDPEFMPKD